MTGVSFANALRRQVTPLPVTTHATSSERGPSLASQGLLESPLQYATSQSSYAIRRAKNMLSRNIYNMLGGNQSKRRKTEYCFESTPAKSKGGSGRGRMKSRSATGNTPSSVLKDCQNLVGNESIEAEQNVATSLSMKIGRREYVNPIPNFLGNLSGTGTIRSEWNGMIRTGLDERAVHMTLFRHRLAATTTSGSSVVVDSASYPDASVVGDILLPVNPGSINVPVKDFGGAATDPFLQLNIQGSCYEHYSSGAPNAPQVSWAPLNRPDYEDMSWNLNHLKLAPPDKAWNSGSLAAGDADLGGSMNQLFAHDVKLGMLDKHRKLSQIEQNNVQGPVYDATTGFPTRSAPYKYDMVFNHGVAHYYFENKHSSGAKVEVIIYRHKKNHIAPTLASATVAGGLGTTNSTGYALTQLRLPIGVGYLNTKQKLLGTDSLNGRLPEPDDIFYNPNYPLLPKLKATVESNQPWAEVMRNVFVLPAGGRRAVDVQFPGDVYDPANVPISRQETTDDTLAQGIYPESSYGLWDHHTYAVVIAVNGTPQTRTVNQIGGNAWKAAGVADSDGICIPTQTTGTDPHYEWSDKHVIQPSDFLILDCHGESNVQYYCSYTEHISGCVYQKTKKKQIFVRGDAINPPHLGGTLVMSEPDTSGEPCFAGWYHGKTFDKVAQFRGVTIVPSTQTVRTTTENTARMQGVTEVITLDNSGTMESTSTVTAQSYADTGTQQNTSNSGASKGSHT